MDANRALRAGIACLLLALLPATASAQTVAFGAYTPGAPYDGGRVIDAFAREVGRKPVVINWYRNWDQDLIVPRDIKTVRDHDAVPLITWEPYGHGLTSIWGGEYDDYIRRAARQVAAEKGPIFVRFAHEMNGSWFPWGLHAGGNTPYDYIRAWRRVVSTFRAEGASNARFVWCPNAGQFDSLYPGDAYVDWLCLDGYNWGARWLTDLGGGIDWPCFGGYNLGSLSATWDALFRDSYADITRLSSRPLMIGETGVNEEGVDKPAWIRDSFNAATMSRYPRLRAVLLFNTNADGAIWRVDSSKAALSAYRTALSDPVFGLDARSLVASPDAPDAAAQADAGGAAQPSAVAHRSGIRCWP